MSEQDDSEVKSVTCLGRMPKVKVEKWRFWTSIYWNILKSPYRQSLSIIHIETSSEMKELTSHVRGSQVALQQARVSRLSRRHGWWFPLDFHWQHLLKALKLLDCGWSFTFFTIFYLVFAEFWWVFLNMFVSNNLQGGRRISCLAPAEQANRDSMATLRKQLRHRALPEKWSEQLTAQGVSLNGKLQNASLVHVNAFHIYWTHSFLVLSEMNHFWLVVISPLLDMLGNWKPSPVRNIACIISTWSEKHCKSSWVSSKMMGLSSGKLT